MKRFKENYIDDLSEINEILNQCYNLRLTSNPKDVNSKRCCIKPSKTTLKVYVKLDGHEYPEMFIFKLDGSKASENKANGLKAFQQLQKMSNNFVVDYSTEEYKGILWDEWDIERGKPIWKCGYERALLEFNSNYNNIRFNNCYGYDVNSSYPFCMLCDMPDCSKGFRQYRLRDIFDNVVGEDEIGFYRNQEDRLVIAESGENAEYIFKRVKSPFKDYVDKYYKLKKNAKNKAERQQAKDYLNFAIGYVLRKNPFIHACVLNNARKYIEQFKDEDTLYCNTDSIVSKTRRLDIEQYLGLELGQFKLEHQGDFAIKNGHYQWNKDVPVARGISKEWFKNKSAKYDLLVDELPNSDYNKYIYDEIEMQVIYNDNIDISEVE